MLVWWRGFHGSSNKRQWCGVDNECDESVLLLLAAADISPASGWGSIVSGNEHKTSEFI